MSLVSNVSSRYYQPMKLHSIYDTLERLSNLLRTDARNKGTEYGLQPVQLEALHYLSVCNRFSDTPMAVTEYLGQTKGTVSQTLKVLKKKGFLHKKADPNDKRVTHLKVTTAGAKILESTIPTPLFVNTCESLTDKAQSDIDKALKQLLIVIIKSNNMKSFGTCHSCRHNEKREAGYYCQLVKTPLSKIDITLICREHQDVA